MDAVLFLLKALFWVGAAALALVAVTILAIIAMVKLREKRALKTLAGMSCPSCGKQYGWPAAVAARELYIAEFRELQRQHPGIKFRHTEVWKIECPSCKATAEFLPSALKLRSAMA
jgi:hypothetical protein